MKHELVLSHAALDEALAGRRQSPPRPALRAAAGRLPNVVSMAPFLILAVVNLLAHFIPFERIALSEDSLCRLVYFRINPSAFVHELAALDRPLEALHYPILSIAGEDPFRGAAIVFLASTLLTWCAYLVLRFLLKEPRWAMLAALFYLLIPNKLELYYTLDYSNHNAFSATYLLSFIFFGLFLRQGRRPWLALSLLSYTVAIFWNELGFFLPGVLLAYALLTDRRKAWAALLFGVPALLYTGWRFGLFLPPRPGGVPFPRFELLLLHAFVQAPNLYLGRQMAKAVLYGLYRFTAMEPLWIWLLLAADIVLLTVLIRWLRRVTLPPLGLRVALLSTTIFLFLFIPGLLNWGVTGRNTALAAVGFSGLVMGWVSRLKRTRQVSLLASLLGFGLLISQGTAWSHVEASRIENDVYETLVQKKQEILNSERVLIDQYSFAQKIPYSWVRDPHNQLDTYWGVTALLGGKGYPFLVHLALGEQRPIFVVRSAMKRLGGSYRFKVYNMATYALEEATVPATGNFLLNYDAVYSEGRRRLPPGVKTR